MTITLYQNDLPDDVNLEGDLAIDTETMGLNLYRDKLCLLQFSNGNGDAHLVHFLDQNYNAPNLKNLLSDKERCKIFHFARFDLAAIKKYLGVELENIFCTKISSKLVRTYTESHGLKDICRELLGVNISKQQQSSYWGADNLSSDQQEYAAKDVLYLHKLREHLIAMLVKENRFELAQDIFKFLPTRANLDLVGWDEVDIFTH
ncbi:MAG TPA: ribonuclease D [Rickettsia endosymbiont of Diachasma alloeum]|nr:ribonuclease D [Rickettsia endosymbiont of Diachasma alloeum]